MHTQQAIIITPNISVEDFIYPELEPYNSSYLPVSDTHKIYYEESGNPNGIPIVYVHGGPGAASKPKHRRFFNPKDYRIILFDQRGCGKSEPFGECAENTLPHIVADMETLRHHLKVDKWVVFGGSWGSTVSLSYAEKNVDKLLGLIVWGVFLGADWQLEWLGATGQAMLFPEEYAVFQKVTGAKSSGLTECYEILKNGSYDKQKKVALAFSRWHLAGMQLLPGLLEEPTTEVEWQGIIKMNLLFLEYALAKFYMTENQLLEQAHKLAHIPGKIIQARYDICCPVKGAYDLSQVWPNAEFTIVPDASHRHGHEPALAKALVAATDDFAKMLA